MNSPRTTRSRRRGGTVGTTLDWPSAMVMVGGRWASAADHPGLLELDEVGSGAGIDGGTVGGGGALSLDVGAGWLVVVVSLRFCEEGHNGFGAWLLDGCPDCNRLLRTRSIACSSAPSERGGGSNSVRCCSPRSVTWFGGEFRWTEDGGWLPEERRAMRAALRPVSGRPAAWQRARSS